MLTIHKFKIKHKGNVIYDCELCKKDKNLISDREDIFTTVIIGENGSGKSYFLKMISDFLRFSKDKSVSIKYEEVVIEYSVGHNFFKIIKSKNKINYYKNNLFISKDEMEFPRRVLALSFMVNDKFSFANSTQDYNYLGVRATSNATYTSTIQKKLLASILNILRRENKMVSLDKVFSFVGLKASIEVRYRLKRKTLFSRGVSLDWLKSKYDKTSSYKKYVNKNFFESKDVKLEDLHRYISDINSYTVLSGEDIVFSLNMNEKTNELYFKSIERLELLETLDLISSPEIIFSRDDFFDFEYTSSGEKHFVFTMINLISSIEENSLVLIDEPEISLHPRWQMKYINLLKDIMKDYVNSHCILASHSHFMVSNLSPVSSSLVSLRKERNDNFEVRKSELIPYSTYAWSAENILYEVFELRTTRNEYFEEHVRKLLFLISTNSKDTNKIKELRDKLKKYILTDSDPMNVVISQSGEYLESIYND
ncbi:AAA family ATPase [Vibrio vulnificus]|uniref:AAA family ATPase n=1 Tax=Vibrio vulnificus TaxID=672 RepID=UPI003242647B